MAKTDREQMTDKQIAREGKTKRQTVMEMEKGR
jgi:hypothetical protein